MYQRQDLTSCLNGIWIPLITPFYEGQVDEASLKNLVRHYGPTGVTGYVVLGTTGESMTVTETERDQIVQIVQSENKERLPVLLGHCGVDTQALCRRIRQTNELPVDGYLITSPYYVKPPQDGLIAHYRMAAQAAGALPIVLYNIPGRTGSNMLNETVLDLATLPNIVAIKDCCGNATQTRELIEAAATLRQNRGLAFQVFTGNDNTLFDHLSLRGAGGIMASSHIETEEFVRFFKLMQAHQIDEARTIWDRLSQHINLLFRESNPGPVKYWLAEQGLIRSADMRLPMTRISEALQKDIRETVASLSATAQTRTLRIA